MCVWTSSVVILCNIDVLDSSAVDRGIENRLGQTKDYNSDIGIKVYACNSKEYMAPI